MNTRHYLSISLASTYMLTLIVLSTIVFHACYTPEANVKNQSSSNGYSTNEDSKTPYDLYSEANWQKTFVSLRRLFPDIQLLRNYVKEVGLEKNVENMNTLLYNGMKNATIDKVIDIQQYEKFKNEDNTNIGLYNYTITKEKDNIERLLIDFALMGITAEKIESVYDKYQFNMFRNTPYYTLETIKQEPLFKECYSSTIIVGEFENIQSDVSLKDGFISSITIKVISTLKGTVNNHDRIVIRGYSGVEPDSTWSYYSHSPENFYYQRGVRQIFYLSHELYLAEVAAPTGRAARKYIDRITKIDRENCYSCLFSPTVIPNNMEVEKNENVIKCKEIAKMLK